MGQTCYTTTDLALAQGTVLRGHFAEGAIGQTENADYSVDRTYVVTVDEEKEGEDKKKKKSHLILSDRKAGVIPERHVNSVRVLANIQPNYMCKVRVGSHSSSMNFW